MYYQEWVEGCRVTFSDWYGKDENGETPVHISFEYFVPGSSIARSPKWEKSYIYSADKARFIHKYTSSFMLNVVYGNKEEPFTEYRDGIKIKEAQTA